MNQHLHVLHVELHNIIMEFFYVQQTHIFYIWINPNYSPL
jgi:hypothetical protein